MTGPSKQSRDAEFSAASRRLRLARELVVSIQFVGGRSTLDAGLGDCVESPVDSIGCGYDGRTIYVGGAFAALDRRVAYLALRATIGSFERTGTYGGREYIGTRHLTAAMGSDGELRLFGPLRIQLGVFHRRIFDEQHESAVGEAPHFTAVTGGFGLTFRQRNGG